MQVKQLKKMISHSEDRNWAHLLYDVQSKNKEEIPMWNGKKIPSILSVETNSHIIQQATHLRIIETHSFERIKRMTRF